MERNIAWIDCESTSVDTNTARIVQIALAITDSKLYKLSNTFTQLIDPTIAIPAEATEIHGITDEMVALSPRFVDVAPNLYHAIKDCDLGFYNGIKFDLPLIIEEFKRAGIDFFYADKKLIDPYVVFKTKEPRDLTSALMFYTGKTMENAHDAGADIEATIEVLRGQIDRYPDLPTIDEVYALTEPEKRCDLAGKFKVHNGKVVYNFGPHYLKPVESEIGFLNWMLGKDFPTDTKNYCQFLLKSLSQ